MSDLAAQVLAAARARGARIVTAESCTGGLLGAALTAPPGASEVMVGGLVTYSNGAKMALLGVGSATLANFGAVSEPVAQEMALGALQALTEGNLALSITGIAGPGGSDHKPEGRVCFGLAWRTDPQDHAQMQAQTLTRDFGALGRDGVRQSATDTGLRLLLQHLLSPARA